MFREKPIWVSIQQNWYFRTTFREQQNTNKFRKASRNDFEVLIFRHLKKTLKAVFFQKSIKFELIFINFQQYYCLKIPCRMQFSLNFTRKQTKTQRFVVSFQRFRMSQLINGQTLAKSMRCKLSLPFFLSWNIGKR